jgi:uncharacterized protein (TIGR02391 family)
MPVEKLSLGTIESVSKILGDTQKGFTGTEIRKFLAECSIIDPGLNSTKWKRIYDSLVQKQAEDQCGNNVLVFIQHVMRPSRHYDSLEWFSEIRSKLNLALSFEGLELGEDGMVKRTTKTKTISEAAARASKLKESLSLRKVHPDIYTFCREELVSDNYFHAVFEATKSVAEKIRNKTGLTSDGADLVDEAFKFKNQVPYLALNSLQTESEQSEQKGFMNLLKGVFGTFRNTTAHAPKIVWKIEEQDALDILSMVSLIHRRLDNAVEARRIYTGQP